MLFANKSSTLQCDHCHHCIFKILFKVLFIYEKTFFFFFWPSLHFKDEETGSELACVSNELEFKCRLAPTLCSFSQTTLSKPELLASCYCHWT